MKLKINNIFRKENQNRQWVDDVRAGRAISLDYFKKNAWLLVLLVVTVLALIGLRYKTKTRMAEIKTLTTALKQAESDKLQAKAAYMSLIRETEMKRLVEEKGLDLQFREQPPYHRVTNPQND